VDAGRATRLLGAVTPENAREERERLVAEVEAGRLALPRWRYARVDRGAVRRALEASLGRLDRVPGEVARLYRDRGRELILEATIAEAAGTPAVSSLADALFGPGSPDATRLARAWISLPPASDPASLVSSDTRDPASLASRLAAEVARLGLPFEVVVHPGLTSLAAVGERQIFVAEGRRLSAHDVERTVVHEIAGHAVPRARAASAGLPILVCGTARGTCDQEGLAIVLEARAGLLSEGRRRELAARHLVVDAMRDGAAFPDSVEMALAWGFGPREAVLIAERAFRGGTGSSPGLGRERVYLDAFLRVTARLHAHPEDEVVLSRGQVAEAEIEAVRPLLDAAPS
jgi:hypothetical protein